MSDSSQRLTDVNMTKILMHTVCMQEKKYKKGEEVCSVIICVFLCFFPFRFRMQMQNESLSLLQI
jgi:hypothetical protein